ncbi:MAG TPA: hypothetical protein VMF06_21325 [Candidatus Limnocylindria bacterium]|nr:hypothetical protein [Candidatus Limnocylindria bacterium]
MNITPHHHSRKAAFTLVEIALCIAVVAIAMVALIGILPTGLTIQKQNREETLLAQEAQYLMDVIRNGNTSLDVMTNYVDWIELARWYPNDAPNSPTIHRYSGYGDPIFNGGPPTSPGAFVTDELSHGSRIVGLLSRPKYEIIPVGGKSVMVTNRVRAFLRPSSGTISDRPYFNPTQDAHPTAQQLDIAFRYVATVEVTLIPTNYTLISKAFTPTNLPPAASLTDIKITFQWPVIVNPGTTPNNPRVRIGPNVKVFRSQAEGAPLRLVGTNSVADASLFLSTNSTANPTYLYRFQPGTL